MRWIGTVIVVGMVACSGSTSDGGGNALSHAELDGTWDFVANGAGPNYAQGYTVVSGSSATVTFVMSLGFDACTYEYRQEVQLSRSADSVAATVTQVSEGTGTGCASPQSRTGTGFTATRTSALPGFGEWGGTWEVTSAGFASGAKCTVKLEGQRATGQCSPGTRNFEGTFDVSLSASTLSGSAIGSNDSIQIAGSKR